MWFSPWMLRISFSAHAPLNRRQASIEARPPTRAPGAADRAVVVDLVRPADELALRVGHDLQGAELQGGVELLREVGASRVELAAGVADRVAPQEGEDVRVVHLGRRVQHVVVDPGVRERRDVVAQDRVAQPVVVQLREHLRLRVPVLEVRLRQRREGAVPPLLDGVDQGVLVGADVEEPLVIFLQEIPVAQVGGLDLDAEVFVEARRRAAASTACAGSRTGRDTPGTTGRASGRSGRGPGRRGRLGGCRRWPSGRW